MFTRKSTIGTRLYREIDPSVSPEMQRFWSVMADLLKVSLPIGDRGGLNPAPLVLSVPAKKLWVEFHNYIEVKLNKGEVLSDIQAFGSKAAEHVLRLSGILTCVSDLNAIEISADTMANATTLMNYFVEETLRLAQGVIPNPRSSWPNDSDYGYTRTSFRSFTSKKFTSAGPTHSGMLPKQSRPLNCYRNTMVETDWSQETLTGQCGPRHGMWSMFDYSPFDAASVLSRIRNETSQKSSNSSGSSNPDAEEGTTSTGSASTPLEFPKDRSGWTARTLREAVESGQVVVSGPIRLTTVYWSSTPFTIKRDAQSLAEARCVHPR